MCIRDRSYFLETVILGGAYTVEWFKREFGTGDPGWLAATQREAESIPAGAEGLMLLPYWSGAMNPYWDPEARGAVIGWSGIHGRAHLYRAILEGCAFEQRLHSDGVESALSGAGAPAARIERYLVSGGGAESDLWLSIIASATGRKVQRSRAKEAASLGAGMLAAAAAGIHAGVEAAAKAMSARDPRIVGPEPADRERYQALFGTYAGLYPALAGSLRRLSGRAERRDGKTG